MKTFLIEYEVPPMRAIYHDEYQGENESVAQELFHADKPRGRVRKITDVTEVRELDRVKRVLGLLIAWLSTELGEHNVKALLDELHSKE